MKDKRVEKTKALIKSTFLELSQTTSLEKITVKAICDQANIHRGTFYYHYIDVFDLAEKLEISAAQRVAEAILTHYNFDGDTSALLENLFLCLKDYPQDSLLLFGNLKGSSNEKGLNYLYNTLKEASLPHWRAQSHLTEEQLDIIYNHTMYSIFHLLKLWESQTIQMEEKDFRDLYNNIITHGIYSYIYR